MNDQGTVTGHYDIQAGQYGFVRTADGTMTTFYTPGTGRIFPRGIDNAGTIVGYYEADYVSANDFVRLADGTIMSFDIAGSHGIIATNSNTAGSVTGYYETDVGTKHKRKLFHGFVRPADGTMTSFDPQGSKATHPVSINANGVITGYYSTFYEGPGLAGGCTAPL